MGERRGAELIAAERRRQIEAEGWTPEHDDEHDGHDLTLAAESYLWATRLQQLGSTAPMPTMWPWAESWWKPSDDQVRNLVRAGALIAAEIDRIQRREASHG